MIQQEITFQVFCSSLAAIFSYFLQSLKYPKTCLNLSTNGIKSHLFKQASACQMENWVTLSHILSLQIECSGFDWIEEKSSSKTSTLCQCDFFIFMFSFPFSPSYGQYSCLILPITFQNWFLLYYVFDQKWQYRNPKAVFN